MRKRKLDLTAEIDRLEAQPLGQLRDEWRGRFQTPPPNRLSRDILIRGITYRLQEKALGGLSKAVIRKVHQPPASKASPTSPRQPRLTLKPGTRLVRDWHGVTHTVIILDNGVEWRGQRYRSLSVVAREITGAHWSGPRFFGLTLRSGGGQ